MSSFDKFKSTLIDNSLCNSFPKVLDEWDFVSMSTGDDECICGKKIINTTTMRNLINGNEIIVGSVCVKKFMKDNKRIMTTFQIMNYNENAKQKQLLKRRCVTCSKLFKIHNIDHHEWKLQCVMCYKNKEPKSKKLLVYDCHQCEEKFIDIENLTYDIEHTLLAEYKIYKCFDCRPKDIFI